MKALMAAAALLATTAALPAHARQATGTDHPAGTTAATPAPATGASPAGTTGAAASPASTAAKPADAANPSGITLAQKALDVKPGHYVLDPAHGKITWSVSHLGFSVYEGQFSAVSAELDLDPKDLSKTTLTATVKTDSIATENPDLDKELKSPEFFDVAKYPEATFKSTKITVTGPQSARIDGDLTLHGKTFPIVISATFNNAGVDPIDRVYTAGFDGATIIRRSTYDITKYVPLVGDNVTLNLEGEFKLKS